MDVFFDEKAIYSNVQPKQAKNLLKKGSKSVKAQLKLVESWLECQGTIIKETSNWAEAATKCCIDRDFEYEKVREIFSRTILLVNCSVQKRKDTLSKVIDQVYKPLTAVKLGMQKLMTSVKPWRNKADQGTRVLTEGVDGSICNKFEPGHPVRQRAVFHEKMRVEHLQMIWKSFLELTSENHLLLDNTDQKIQVLNSMYLGMNIADSVHGLVNRVGDPLLTENNWFELVGKQVDQHERLSTPAACRSQLVKPSAEAVLAAGDGSWRTELEEKEEGEMDFTSNWLHEHQHCGYQLSPFERLSFVHMDMKKTAACAGELDLAGLLTLSYQGESDSDSEDELAGYRDWRQFMKKHPNEFRARENLHVTKLLTSKDFLYLTSRGKHSLKAHLKLMVNFSTMVKKISQVMDAWADKVKKTLRKKDFEYGQGELWDLIACQGAMAEADAAIWKNIRQTLQDPLDYFKWKVRDYVDKVQSKKYLDLQQEFIHIRDDITEKTSESFPGFDIIRSQGKAMKLQVSEIEQEKSRLTTVIEQIGYFVRALQQKDTNFIKRSTHAFMKDLIKVRPEVIVADHLVEVIGCTARYTGPSRYYDTETFTSPSTRCFNTFLEEQRSSWRHMSIFHPSFEMDQAPADFVDDWMEVLAEKGFERQFFTFFLYGIEEEPELGKIEGIDLD